MGKCENFSGMTVAASSVFILLTCGFAAWILYYFVTPLPDVPESQSAKSAISILATVLAILVGGGIAGFFSFEYDSVEIKEKTGVVLTAWLFIAGLFLFIFLAMYCLYKIGAFSAIDPWVVWVLFFSTFLLLDAIVLLERWDATQLP